jgi:hypothetical protein
VGAPAADEPAIDWLELVPAFGCNCRCRICPSSRLPAGQRMTPEEIGGWMHRGRQRGAGGIWFGGGEPTLLPALAAWIEQAAAAGYRRIRVQSNGLRFAYPDYARRLVEAGLNSACLSVKGATAALHDDITRVPGAFDLLGRAVAELAGLGVAVRADVLITTPTLEQLPRAVEHFAGLGCGGFTFWLVSLHGLDAGADAHWLPPLAAVRPALEAAFERAAALGVDASSLHTPPCSLSPAHRERYFHSGRYRLLVATPGQPAFMAERSPMEGGAYPAVCNGCAARPDCLGLRRDYLELHGQKGLQPIGPTDRQAPEAGAEKQPG